MTPHPAAATWYPFSVNADTPPALTLGSGDEDPEEAHMLLAIVGELRIETSPWPVIAARLIVPLETLAAAGWSPPW